MRLKLLVPLALLPLLGACASDPEPWLSQASVAADVAPTGQTLVQTHYALGPDCEPLPAPEVVVLQPGQLGEIFLRASSEVIESPLGAEENADMEQMREAYPCVGVSVPATQVWYAAGGQPGVDSVVYREVTEGARPSRNWLAAVRIRE